MKFLNGSLQNDNKESLTPNNELDKGSHIGDFKGAKIGERGHDMTTVKQKKFSITLEQSIFLKSYKQWGYNDQSSIVREALNLLIHNLKKNQRKTEMAQKARELLPDYATDREITSFIALDGEDFQ